MPSTRARRATVPAPNDRSGTDPGPDLPAGLRTGDGVFETIRTYGGRPFQLDRHLARLEEGARAIGLPLPAPLPELERYCRAALAQRAVRRDAEEWILRPLVYAADGRGRWAITVDPLVVPRRSSSRRTCVVGLSSYPHPGRYLVPPGAQAPVKWLARGPLSHALREGRERGWDEALLRDPDGNWIEGTRSNLLAVVDEALVAPGPHSHALPGITREVVLEEAARLGRTVEDRPVEAREARSATEILLTSTLLGVVSIARVAGVRTTLGRTPGPVARALRRAFEDRVRAELLVPLRQK